MSGSLMTIGVGTSISATPIGGSTNINGNVSVDTSTDAPLIIQPFFTISQIDAFQRIRVSANNQSLDSQFVFDKQPLLWSEKLVGGASAAVHNPDSTIVLNTSAIGQQIIRQTKRYYKYRAGQSRLIIMTFANMQAETNIEKEVGYGDANDGIFLTSSNGVVSFVRRSSTSVGTLVVPQSLWNIDKLDGTGVSGITADFAKTQILAIDFQWLGTGTVLCGFMIGRQYFPVHRFDHANVETTTYMRQGTLPIRYAIAQSGVGSGSLKQICSTVVREGGDEAEGVQVCCTTPSAGITATATPQSMLQVRLNATYIRAFAKLALATAMALADQNIFFQVVLNPVWVLGSPTWSPQSNTILDVATNQLAYVAGSGLLLGAGYVSGTGGRTPSMLEIDSSLGLSADIDGTPDVIAVIASAAGKLFGCQLFFKELY